MIEVSDVHNRCNMSIWVRGRSVYYTRRMDPASLIFLTDVVLIIFQKCSFQCNYMPYFCLSVCCVIFNANKRLTISLQFCLSKLEVAWVKTAYTFYYII